MTQEDKDFTFIFNFGDNDFGLHFEYAAKLYCDEYNGRLSDDYMYKYNKESYIKHIDNLEKRETIINSLKKGIAAYTFRNSNRFDDCCLSFEEIMEKVNKYVNEYFDFEGKLDIYSKDENNNYFVSGIKPRLVVGTRADIEDTLKCYGTHDEDGVEPREFPYWCNGEVLIVYMKDKFLNFVIR